MKSFAVYAIRNVLTGEMYIGGSTNVEARWRLHKSHLSHGIHHSPRLQADWDRLGKKAFEFVILEDRFKNIFHLLRVEQKWIDHFDAVNSGYNVLPKAGSRAGSKQTKETKAKIKEAMQKRVLSPEHRAKIGAGQLGRVLSEETKARISAARKGKGHPHTEASKAKIAAANRRRAVLRTTINDLPV